jgi:hypothetical protein
MDEGLTWKALLNNVMTEAYRAFWTCRGTFGKTWGLKPKVMYWIYTMVIRPTLVYVFAIWWLRITYKVSRAELSRL